MKLLHSKLEKPRERGGKIIARCPACAELGRDRAADNLAIMRPGEEGEHFACAAFLGDTEHARRIIELVGDRTHDRDFSAPVYRPAPRKEEKPLPADFEHITRTARRIVYESRDVQRMIAKHFHVSPDAVRELSMPEGGALGFFPAASYKGKPLAPDRIGYIYPQGIKLRAPFGEGGPRFMWLHGRATEPWRFSLSAWRESIDRWIITEGESDLVALHDAGIWRDHRTAIVASPGTSFREEWAALFKGRNVAIAFDADKAGEDAAPSAKAILRRHAAKVSTFNLPKDTP